MAVSSLFMCDAVDIEKTHYTSLLHISCGFCSEFFLVLKFGVYYCYLWQNSIDVTLLYACLKSRADCVLN